MSPILNRCTSLVLLVLCLFKGYSQDNRQYSFFEQLKINEYLDYFSKYSGNLTVHSPKVRKNRNYPLDSVISNITQDAINIFPEHRKLILPNNINLATGKEKTIFKTLQKQWGKPFDSSWDRSSTLWQQIVYLKATETRVWLALTYSILRIQPQNSYQHAYSVLPTIVDLIQPIKEPIRRSIAFEHLGNYAYRYCIYDYALQYYYGSLMCFYEIDDHTKIVKKTRDATAASINKQVSYIFNLQRLPQADSKSMSFFEAAFDIYVKRKDMAGLTALTIEMLGIRGNQYVNDKIPSFNDKIAFLKFLKMLFEVNLKGTIAHDRESYITSYVIGQVLQKEGRLTEAQAYYLMAIQHAMFTQEPYFIFRCLESISRIYAILGKAEYALRYANFGIEFSKKMNLPFENAHSNLLKGEILHRLHSPDSALVYLNNIQFDHTLYQSLSSTNASQLYERTIGIKYDVLSKYPLRYDSIFYYRTRLDTALIWRLTDYVNLQESQLGATVSLNDAISAREKRLIKNALIREQALKNEIEELSLKQRLLDSGHIHTLTSLTDSLQRTNTELDTAKNRLFRKNKELVAAIEEKDKTQDLLTWMIGISLVALVCLAFVSRRVILLNKRLKQKSGELEENLTLAQNNLAEMRVFKKISDHDIQKLVLNIPTVVRKINLESSKEQIYKALFNNATAVQDYLRAIFKLNTTVSSVQDEVKRAVLYAEAFGQTCLPTNQIVTVTNEIKDPFVLEHLQIPTLLLNNFVKNSIEHGFHDDNPHELNVVIKQAQSHNGYTLIVEDNGRGINAARSISSAMVGNGISLLKESIAAFNRTKRDFFIIFEDEFLIDKSDLDNATHGTRASVHLFKKNWLA